MIIETSPDLTITVQTSGVVDVNIGSLYFEFTQATTVTTWELQHNLNKPYPYVFAKDSEGNEVIGHFTFINNDYGTLTFLEPIAGKAWLS